MKILKAMSSKARVECLVLQELWDGDSAHQGAMSYPGYLFQKFLPEDQEASFALRLSRHRSIYVFCVVPFCPSATESFWLLLCLLE